jgi:hypothetical protein
MRISISKKAYSKLEEHLKNCLFVRATDSSSADELARAAYSTVVSASGTLDYDQKTSLDIEVFSFEEALKDTLNLVLNHSIDGSIYAFTRLSPEYKQILLSTVYEDPSILEDDPSIRVGKPKAPLDEIRSKINDLLSPLYNRLKIDCSRQISIRDGSENTSILGTYDEDTKTLYVFPISLLFAAGSKLNEPLRQQGMPAEYLRSRAARCSADFIAATAIHALIHEFAHLSFPCFAEKQILSGIWEKEVKRVAKSLIRQRAKAGKQMTMEEAVLGVKSLMAYGMGVTTSEILTYGKDLAGAMAHCARFKLGLLYLLTQRTAEYTLVRSMFAPVFVQKILASEILTIAPTTGRPSVDIDAVLQDPDSASVFFHYAQYGWEDEVSASIVQEFKRGNLKFTFRSDVVKTSDIFAELEKRQKRPNYAKTAFSDITQEDITSDDLLYTVDGEANLLKVPFLEDALAFLTNLVNRNEFVPSREVDLSERAGLYAMLDLDDNRIKLVYCPDSFSFFEVTTAEAWFILTL